MAFCSCALWVGLLQLRQVRSAPDSQAPIKSKLSQNFRQSFGALLFQVRGQLVAQALGLHLQLTLKLNLLCGHDRL